MSWSATFLADFTQWDQALRQAETKLGAFEQSTLKTKNSLQKMVSEFDGSKVIQQAGTMEEAVRRAGGAATLTDRELRKVNDTLQEALQKYQKLGQDAPAGLRSMADAVSAQLRPLEEAGKKTTLWGTALGSVKTVAAGFIAGFTLDRVIGGLANAAASTIAWGGALTDMAAKTGVSTTALQRWEYAAKQGGNTLDQVVKASGELSKKLAEGQGSTVAALERLGLNLDTLRRMSPEQQFDEVAAALARTSDQGTRASASMALLGDSGKELLPTLTSDMKALGDEAERLGVIVDEQTLQAMDELGDAWQKMKDAGRGLLAEVLSPMVPAMNNIAAAAANAAKALREDFWAAAWKFSAVGAGGPLGMGAMFMQQFGGPGGGTTTPGRAPVPVVTTSEFVGSQHGLAGQDVVAGVFMRDLVPAARESAAALRQVAQSAAVLRDVNILNGSRNGGVSIFQTLPNQVPLAQLTRGMVALGGQNNPWGGVSQTTDVMGAPGTSYSHLTRPGFSWGQAGAAGLTAAMPFLSQLVTGGSRGGQIGGSIGGSLGGAIGSMSSVIGAVGSFAPFIGPIAGIVGSLIGNLFGPSRGAILGKEADARMDQTRAGLLQQYGSLDAIRATGAQGAALADAWNSKNVQGEQWFNERVKAFEEQNRLLGEQRDIQSQIAGIEAERKGWADSLVTTWDQVVGYAEKYGIHIEGMGPKIVQLGQTATWTDMLNAIQALERAGGDVGGILVGMTDEMSTLVQQSRRAGTEIPSNLKPYIQSVADAGKLLDENGEAITDLSGIKWGDPVKSQADIAKAAMEKLDEAMQNLVDRLDQIIDRLTNGLPAAASTPLPTVRIPYEYEHVGGEPGRPDGEPGYASGGLITRPHRAWVGEGGQPELIGPVDFMARALAGALSRVGTGGARVVQVVLDRRVLAEALVDEIPGALRRAGAF